MRLRKIPIDFLWEGLELSGDIYNDRGSVLLLKRGEVLTQERLDKLSKFERGGYITTSEETYQEILNSGKAPRADLRCCCFRLSQAGIFGMEKNNYK